jgi:diguanylate cyclase (GGDEF)-like protein/PAS domain S-box-containing protein
MISFITASCLAIQFFAPVEWRPEVIWLVLAPGCGLIFGAVPALLMRLRTRRQDAAARDQKELLSLLLRDYAAERGGWLWSTDSDGMLRGVTEKFARHAGLSVTELEGRHFADFLQRAAETGTTGQASQSDLLLALRHKRSFSGIEVAVPAKGRLRWWRLAGKPVFRDDRFSGYIGTAKDATVEVKAREKVSYLAFHDHLTGLPNRSRLTAKLAESVARLDRYGTPFALLYLDLDKFKAVNDSEGHQTGDHLLVEAGKRLKAHLREIDLVARLGGDEFCIIMPEAAEPGGISELAQRLVSEIAKPFTINGTTLTIGLSVGIALAPANGRNADELLHHADLALYRSKQAGGNRYSFFETEMDAQVRDRRMLQAELAEAITRNEFVLHFQPLVSPVEDVVSGFEALIRWNHPRRGLLLPPEFIPTAERSSLICDIGFWTIEEAARMLAQLPPRLSIAINLSAKQFRTCDVVASVLGALKAAGVDPRRLEIELRDGLLADPSTSIAGKLQDLRSAGVRITMDDLGTGQAGLPQLVGFTGDTVKIDRSFVAAHAGTPRGRDILKATISLARSLRLRVAAGGVETEEQANFLRESGCDVLQGFYFASPMPATSLAAQLGLAAANDESSSRARVRTA